MVYGVIWNLKYFCWDFNDPYILPCIYVTAKDNNLNVYILYNM